MILKATISFLLIFLFPGCITFHAFRIKGRRFSEMVFLSILCSVLLSSWFGLVLAELGRFSLPNLLLLLVVYSAAIALAFKVRLTWGDFPKPRLDYQSLLLVIIVLIAFILFFRPFESILGTTDAGVYIGMGANIAKTGAIRARDLLLVDLTDDVKWDLLYRRKFLFGSELMRFFGDGVRIWDMRRGIFFSQQNHLYQVWIAIFYSIFGMARGANPLSPFDLLGILEHFSKTPLFLYVTPTFGLLGVVSLYFVGRTLFDRKIGLLASFLLTVNIVQIWFSRWAMSEALTQFVVLGAIYCCTLYLRTGHRYLGLMAGFALGLAILSKVDAILLIVPVALFFAYLRFTRQLHSEHLYFFVPFVGLLLHCSIHTFLFSPTHLLAICKSLPHYGSVVPLAVGGGLSIMILLVLASLNSGKIVSVLARCSAYKKWIRPLAAALLLLLAFYAYFIRPNVSTQVAYYPTGEGMRTYNEQNLVRLGWYLSPLGLLLALGGLSAIILKEADKGTAFLVGTALTYCFVFLYSALVSPLHIYWVRRYMIVVIPSMMLFISCALFGLKRGVAFGRWGGVAAVVLGAVLTASFAHTSLAIASRAPYRGVVKQMDRFAEQLGDEAVVVFESPLIGDALAPPLTFLYGRDSFVLQERNPNSKGFFNVLERWQSRSKEVFYVAFGGLTRVRSDDYVFTPIGEATFEISIPKVSFDHIPTGIVHHVYNLEIYRIEQRDRETDIYPFSLDVGRFDYGYLVNGFYSREEGPKGWYRWTGKTAEMIVPWSSKADKLVLSLGVGSQRPEEVEPAKVSVYLNDILIDRFNLGNEFETHSIVVPSGWVSSPQTGVAFLRLETNSWVPAEAGLQDIRELGIVIDWVRVEEMR